jgi:hypothetical protein
MNTDTQIKFIKYKNIHNSLNYELRVLNDSIEKLRTQIYQNESLMQKHCNHTFCLNESDIVYGERSIRRCIHCGLTS